MLFFVSCMVKSVKSPFSLHTQVLVLCGCSRFSLLPTDRYQLVKKHVLLFYGISKQSSVITYRHNTA